MAKKKSRELNKKSDTKILRWLSKGFCMFNEEWVFCEERNLQKKADWEMITFAEQAHITPHSDAWPRSIDWQVKSDSYRNRLLLCPNHHTKVDNDPWKYSTNILDAMLDKVIERYYTEPQPQYSSIITEESHTISIQYKMFLEKVSYLKQSVNNGALSNQKKHIKKILLDSQTLFRHFILNAKWNNRLLFLGLDNVKELLDIHKNYPPIAYIIITHPTDDYIPELIEVFSYLIDLCWEEYGPIASLLRRLKEAAIDKTIIISLIKKLAKKKSFSDYFVQSALIDLLPIFIDTSYSKFMFAMVTKILRKYKPSSNITVWLSSLPLRLQWRDLDDHVFGDLLDLLWSLAWTEKYAKQTFTILINLLNEQLSHDTKNIDKIQWIMNDSSIRDDASDYQTDLRYEYEKVKRYKWEIRRWLISLHKDANTSIVIEIMDYLLIQKRQSYYTIILQFLQWFIVDYKEFAEKLIFDQDLWSVWFVRDWYLQKLITAYFACDASKLEEYIRQVQEYKDKKAQAKLLVAIPEQLQTPILKDFLNQLSTQEGVYPSVAKYISIGDVHGRELLEEVAEDKTEKEIYDIVVSKLDSPEFRSWRYDIGNSIVTYIGSDLQRAIALLQLFSETKWEEALNIKKRIIWTACKIVEEGEQEYYDKLIKLQDIYPFVEALELGDVPFLRALNRIVRSTKTQFLASEDSILYDSIKSYIIALSYYGDPETDGEVHQEEGIDRWISVAMNSTRSLALEALIIFAHYNPDDKKIATRIFEMSDDTTLTVQSYLVWNLKYLITKNYDLCKSIIDKYSHVRQLSIDYALTHYFLHLGKHKIVDVKDLVYSLLWEYTEEKIQRNLWILLWYMIVDNLWLLAESIEKVLSGKLGNVDTLTGMMEVLMVNVLAKIHTDDETQLIEWLEYIKKIIANYDKDLIKDQLMRYLWTFLFSSNDLGVAGFQKLHRLGFIDHIIALNSSSIDLHRDIVFCIEELAKKGVLLEEGIDTLYRQVESSAPIFADGYIADHVRNILQLCFDNKWDVSTETMQKAIKVFDHWLEIGFDSFYELYHEYFESNKIDLAEYS